MKRNPPNKVFAKRLKSLRYTSGLSGAVLGNIAGVGADMINKYESGLCTPTPRTLAALSNALDYNLLTCWGFKHQ